MYSCAVDPSDFYGCYKPTKQKKKESFMKPIYGFTSSSVFLILSYCHKKSHVVFFFCNISSGQCLSVISGLLFTLLLARARRLACYSYPLFLPRARTQLLPREVFMKTCYPFKHKLINLILIRIPKNLLLTYEKLP